MILLDATTTLLLLLLEWCQGNYFFFFIHLITPKKIILCISKKSRKKWGATKKVRNNLKNWFSFRPFLNKIKNKDEEEKFPKCHSSSFSVLFCVTQNWETKKKKILISKKLFCRFQCCCCCWFICCDCVVAVGKL